MLSMMLHWHEASDIRNFLLSNCLLSCVQVHLAWIKTPRNKGGLGHMKIPILADTKKACSFDLQNLEVKLPMPSVKLDRYSRPKVSKKMLT